MKRYSLSTIILIFLFALSVAAQLPASAAGEGSVDFKRDIQPLFKANCVGCHGPSVQKNSFRLDRRHDAMRGGTISVIGPGNSSGSRLYLRLIGSEVGMQMPPTGALPPDKIDLIKKWIDQGARWPDDASGEAPPLPQDAHAAAMMEALRNNDQRAFLRLLTRYPEAVKLRGPGGSTPLMYAAFYGDDEMLRRLLGKGADPNARNSAGATALMWAVTDLPKTQRLIEAGADVNAHSDDGLTPLLIAASQYGSSAIVKLLLDRGADPSIKVSSATGEMTPLSQAAYAGDADMIQLLLERGASVKKAGFFPLTFAALSLCLRCVDLLVKQAEPADLNMAMFFGAPPFADPRSARLLIDRGADIKATDPEGRTILMLAAGSATAPVDTIKALLDHGADVNAKTSKGDTALDFARRHGQTPVVDLLVRAGARGGNPAKEWFAKPAPAKSIAAAINRSIPLLQRTDVSFLQKTGCVSCHNNTLTAMTLAAARKSGYAVDEQIARNQLTATSRYLDDWSERARQSVGIPGDADTVGYILLGLAAENHQANATTDAMVRFLKSKQTPNGRWIIFAHRPPIESSDFEVTAVSLRALQLYAPSQERTEYQKAIQLAAGWLRTAEPKENEDYVFKLLGLKWAGANRTVLMKVAAGLLAEQRADGGWAQLSTLASDAYATGQALVALKEAGVITAGDAAYQRGIHFLMNNQLEDGSWYVRSRALPIQPFFESGFPHGRDQFVSAAATNWATMALVQARPAALAQVR